MRTNSHYRKWQILSLVFAVALAISLSFNIYQYSKVSSNNLLKNSSSNNSTDSLGNSNLDNIIGESIILEKVFNETFELTMILKNDTYTLGEPIPFMLKLSNIGNESVEIYYAWMDLLRYWVINPSGDVIYYKNEVPGELALMVIVNENIGINVAHEKLFIWRQVYQEYNTIWPYDENLIITPGNYTIIGQTYFYLKENRFLRVVEATLQIEVRII